MKKTILIVDDEKYIREIYKRIVASSCESVFRLLEAASALDATEYIINENIDLIVLDIRMPSVNGQQLYEVIRKYNPSIKVIVTSVYPIDQQKRLIPFADGYYDKSEGPMSLLEKVVSSFSQDEDNPVNLN